MHADAAVDIPTTTQMASPAKCRHIPLPDNRERQLCHSIAKRCHGPGTAGFSQESNARYSPATVIPTAVLKDPDNRMHLNFVRGKLENLHKLVENETTQYELSTHMRPGADTHRYICRSIEKSSELDLDPEDVSEPVES
ncbi:hypothetical protein SNK03_003384 [Fusarium graminearum]|nr:unnamed protein product [Fusarium graminearum]